MDATPAYTLYGDLEDRATAGLAALLVAKRLRVRLVEESPSLALLLESRSGAARGPYLRTPEGFVLAGDRALREWLERAHPSPSLLPVTPVRRAAARLVEDWVTLWLPLWPRRSWRPVEVLGAHLARSPFLLGQRPCRPDHALAAWLETEVLVDPGVRAHLEAIAPTLEGFGDRLVEAGAAPVTTIDEAETFAEAPALPDDAVPISLLAVLEEIGRDFFAFVPLNHRALKDGETHVDLDLGLGRRPFPTLRAVELARVTLGRELAGVSPGERRRVERVLDPFGLWDALRLPPLADTLDPADPRAL